MNTRLYIGNLEWEVTEDILRDYFKQAGNVKSASVIFHRDTGRSRGFGFIEMESSDEADNAIKMLDGTALNKRVIVVREAKPEGERGDQKGELARIIEFMKKSLPGEKLVMTAGRKQFTLLHNEDLENTWNGNTDPLSE